jgi:uncharacterized spore protein YtfJ
MAEAITGSEVKDLLKSNLEEIEKVLSTKTVVGEPLTMDGITLIPLIKAGFGFGAGAGIGKGASSNKGEGSGGGTGGGAYVRPVAVVIITSEGAKIEPVMGRVTGALEKLGETVPQVIEKWWERRKEG